MTTLALSRLHWTGVFAWLAVSLIGCTQVTEGGVQLGLTVWSIFGGAGQVEGMKVCGPDETNCVTTDPDGKATLTLPADEEITWTLTKEGFGSILIADVTDARFVSNTGVVVPTDDWLQRAYRLIDSPYPFPDTAAVFIWTDPPLAGVTFDLVGAEEGRYYSNETGLPSLALEATTRFGTGGYVEVEVGPGEVLVNIGGTAGCDLGWGWPGDGSNTIRMPVVEGFTTYASVTCESL